MTYLKLDSKCIHLLNWSCVWKNFSQSLKISKTRNLSLEIVSKENSQQKTTADCFLVNLDFQACLHSFMLKLYYFRLTQIIKDQLNLDYELLSFDFDVVIEGVNCRMSMPSLLKLQSLELEKTNSMRKFKQDIFKLTVELVRCNNLFLFKNCNLYCPRLLSKRFTKMHFVCQ